MATRIHLGPQRKAFSGRASNVMPAYVHGKRAQSAFMRSVRPEFVAKRSTRPISNVGGARRYLDSKASNHTGLKVAGAVAGAAAVGYGGYQAYQHRDEIKAKGAQFSNNVHSAFHSTRHMVGAH